MMYILFLFVGFILMNLLLVPSVQDAVVNAFPSVRNESMCRKVLNNQCAHVVCVLVIYRICLSLSSFHFILAILTFMVANSASWRGGMHNGMWGLKILAIFVIFMLTFLIPTYNDDEDGSQTIFIFIIAAFFASLLFQLIQMVIVIATIREMCYKVMNKLSSKAKEDCVYCCKCVCFFVM
ncbi:serine incorporator 5-like isoform X2 [Uloborus diversus]|nr:serine incorporator 5-like isoform X2 [Uloborus diversus]